MSLRLRIVLFAHVMSLIELAAGISVAPGDEEREICLTLRGQGAAPTPSYAPNMRVLMDSFNYQSMLPPRTGAVWAQVDNDTNNRDEVTTNWVQQSNTPCQQNVQVCGFSAGPQSNWLLTQAINRTAVGGVVLSQVSVFLEFELRDCDITLNCQRTFNTYVYETSLVSDAVRSNISNYRQVRRVSPDITTGARVSETVIVNFETNQPIFYFAAEDETTCIIITRMIVFYTVCPNQTIDLISAPEIIAPTVGVTEVIATCASNAVTEDDDDPKLVCSPGGTWTRLGSGCRCAPGSGFVNGSCSLCPIGTYSSPANRDCSSCPANSVSTMAGLHQCTCIEDYYRAETGEEDLPCSLPPLPPMNIRLMVISDNSIFVAWDPPAQIPENRPLLYNVYTSIDGGERFLQMGGINATNFTIMNLLPGTMYTVFVSTATSFTNQLPANVFSTFSMSDRVTTTGSSGGGNSVVAIAVAVVLVVLFVIVASICVIIFLIWICRRADDGAKDFIAQYHEVAELAETTGRKMYVDPSIYASADEAVRDFAREIQPKFLSVKEEIGRGEFGAVYKGMWKSGGKQVPVAIKTLKPHSSAKQRNDFLSEASIMGQFTHPNVVKLYGVVTRVDPVMIIMEFLENGSLYHYLRDNDEKLGNERLLKMARGVAQGMDYLSTIGFVHRDLAARNILVSKNEICKVADFGLSRETVDEIYKVNKGGKIPVRWTAPEAIFRRKFTVSSDVWSYGVLLWEIMTYGQTPYDEMDNQELLDKLDDGYRLEKPHNTPDEVYKLMLECWNEDHIQRPTFAVIESKIEELLQSDSTKPPAKKPKTYLYSSSVATSPLDYDTVNEWLDGLKMGKYKPNFEERGITTTNEVLALDEHQLRKMDIILAGHISKITRSIANGNQKLGREASVRV